MNSVFWYRQSLSAAKNANPEDFAQQYAGSQVAIESTSNYYHIYDTLSEYLDVTVGASQPKAQQPC